MTLNVTRLRFTRMGSARVSRAGFGVSPKRTSICAFSLWRARTFGGSPSRTLKLVTYPIQTLWKRLFWIEDADESVLEKSSETNAKE